MSRYIIDFFKKKLQKKKQKQVDKFTNLSFLSIVLLFGAT